MQREKIQRILRIFLTGMAVLVILGYSLFAAERVLRGPSITIIAPENTAVVDTSLIQITGNVTQASELYVNGRPISVSPEGVFDEHILLSYGYNVIEIVARARSGSTEKKIIEIFYK